MLEGKTGLGKTQGILSFLKDYNPKLIREINDLKDLTPLNKAAIYDDIDLTSIHPDQIKHLFDGEVDGVIRVLYRTVTIDSKLKKVLITNEFKLKDMSDEHLQAILRRVIHVKLNKSLIKSVVYRERELKVNFK